MRFRAVTLLFLAACSARPGVLPQETIRLAAGSVTREIRVELASTDEARRTGLMHRASVPDGAGMLFVYPRAEAWGGFWMKDTLVALDVAFIRDGAIIEVHTLEPCPSDPCPLTFPETPYDRVLEVRAGWLGDQGFGLGTRLTEQPPQT